MTPPVPLRDLSRRDRSQRRAGARCAVRAGAGAGCGAHLAGTRGELRRVRRGDGGDGCRAGRRRRLHAAQWPVGADRRSSARWPAATSSPRSTCSRRTRNSITCSAMRSRGSCSPPAEYARATARPHAREAALQRASSRSASMGSGSKPPRRARARASSADQHAMLMYTSGTTGVPKGVLLTHANMLHAGATVAAHQRLGPADRVLSSLPLYHINGQCIATASTLVAGGSIVMPHRFSASQWWPLVERYRPTWLNLVPTIIAYLLNGPDLDARPARRRRGRSLRALGVGAAAARPAARVRIPLRHSRHRSDGLDRMRIGRVLQSDGPRGAQDRQSRAGRSASPRASCRARDGCSRRGESGADRAQGPQRDARVFPRAGAHRADAVAAMAGSPPATSAIATPTASISSPAAPRSSSSRAARTSRRARSTRRCCAIRRCSKRSRSAFPIATTDRRSPRSWS